MIEIIDRYSATGIPYPDENSCDECEGMGVVPCLSKEVNRYACESPKGCVLIIGQKEEDGSAVADDGYLFLQCPVCEGSRKSAQSFDLRSSHDMFCVCSYCIKIKGGIPDHFRSPPTTKGEQLNDH